MKNSFLKGQTHFMFLLYFTHVMYVLFSQAIFMACMDGPSRNGFTCSFLKHMQEKWMRICLSKSPKSHDQIQAKVNKGIVQNFQTVCKEDVVENVS